MDSHDRFFERRKIDLNPDVHILEPFYLNRPRIRRNSKTSILQTDKSSS